MRILLVEDDRPLGEGICTALKPEGYTVDWLQDGASALHALTHESFDLLVLDLGLPRMDGLELLGRLRAAGQGVPALILTARDATGDRIAGLDAGADDYLVKPFALRELEARIRVLSRKGNAPEGGLVRRMGLEFDPRSQTVRREGREASLTRTQTRLLECLLRESPRVVEHSRLVRAAWGTEGGDPANLHTHIHGLRQAIDKPFAKPLLHTVHGIGYRLAETD